MHNHDDGSDNRMKWGMVLCCGLPLLFFLFWLFGGKIISASSWITWGGIALMVGVHIFMMAGMHKHADDEHDVVEEEDGGKEKVNDKNTHSGHGCCH